VEETKRLVSAAAILAGSQSPEHRLAAYRIATYAYECLGNGTLPLHQALRVVLSRLGNFPALLTREDVATARADLPLMLAVDDVALAEAREIRLAGSTYQLTHFQYELWRHLVSRHRVSLSAPTSSGKSFILQGYLASLFDNEVPRTVAYLVPTRALIAQVSSDLLSWFGKAESAPEIVTVPLDEATSIPPRVVLVMTQERLQLTLAAHPELSATEIVVDEAQGIGDGARGILLQSVVDDLLRRAPTAQVLFAAPAMRNLDLFGRLFGIDDVQSVTSAEPTVGQNFVVVDIEAAVDGRLSIRRAADDDSAEGHQPVATRVLGQTTASRIDRLVQVSAEFGRGQSNIVYADGAAEAEVIAIQLSQIFNERTSTDEREALALLVGEAVHPRYVLAECIRRGVAFHYANIPTQIRRSVELAVIEGTVDYLVCTSTLLQGVNLPAKNIFMCHPKKGIGNALDSTDFWNLAGRAGRLRREFHGNIFLIQYDQWARRPLGGPRDAPVDSAIRRSVADRTADLLATIDNTSTRRSRDVIDLEAAFMRLFTDFKREALSDTLSRIGLDESRHERVQLVEALTGASEVISLPIEVLEKTPNVSPHRQQKLYDRLAAHIADGGRRGALSLIPKHPREDGAYDSYAEILWFCHQDILGLSATRRLHRFHALFALFWMQGMPLPQIIQSRIEYDPDANVRYLIRNTLDLIENQLRFQGVRLFGCYHSLLVHALTMSGFSDLQSSIPAIPLYLEVGASDRTMISLIELGLSRVISAKLNQLASDKRMDVRQTREWLKAQPIDQLDLSPLLRAELRSIIGTS